MIYIAAALCSFLIVFFAVTPLRKIALKRGFVDRPTERKTHKEPVPLVGGMAMFLGFTVAFAVFFVIVKRPEGLNDFLQKMSIIAGASMILGIGIVDDFYKTKGKEFSVLPRMVVQLLAATLVFFAGIRFTGFTNPFNQEYLMFPVIVQYLLTVIWIFGVTTVINWSDGLDGLAGGISAISGFTLFVFAMRIGEFDSALMAVILIGSAAGFLRYNKFPAKIFMGDSGANFLGFILAVIALYGAFKGATVVSVLVPVLALGLPIFDNIFLVIKRFVTKKPIYKADAGQIHHRLLKTGLSPSQTVLVLILVSICLNLTTIIIMLL